MTELTKNIYRKFREMSRCPLFKGTESEQELIQLFLSIQGIEFCTEHNFPDLGTLRKFSDTEKYGIYIDKRVTLSNVSKVVLIGNTNATLTYDDPDKKHEVILMHGAKATIKASGYTVVFVTNSGGTVKKTVADFAKIL